MGHYCSGVRNHGGVTVLYHPRNDAALIFHNPSIREEYNAIRLRLANLLRRLEVVRAQGGDSAAIISLDGLKCEIEEVDLRLDADMDNLILKERISAEMATSLMNDNNYNYASNVAQNLINVEELLFCVGDINLRHAERSLTLEEDEIETALKQSGRDFETG